MLSYIITEYHSRRWTTPSVHNVPIGEGEPLGTSGPQELPNPPIRVYPWFLASLRRKIISTLLRGYVRMRVICSWNQQWHSLVALQCTISIKRYPILGVVMEHGFSKKWIPLKDITIYNGGYRYMLKWKTEELPQLTRFIISDTCYYIHSASIVLLEKLNQGI